MRRELAMQLADQFRALGAGMSLSVSMHTCFLLLGTGLQAAFLQAAAACVQSHNVSDSCPTGLLYESRHPRCACRKQWS